MTAPADQLSPFRQEAVGKVADQRELPGVLRAKAGWTARVDKLGRLRRGLGSAETE
ncbi:hypothetical protein [Phytomonospora endophytica]|uniref:Uncharacterized protein n=1 Tax=Phytomonospora endophytica TaxID=714109 RepID=A0A841G111_9ACTN|nr:hypothetical protein [Phytomonospora endophytica]MBB6038369.1 hypothetical protein [Phytomonospora endophytica]